MLKFGTQSRFLLWVIALSVPGAVAAWLAMAVVETRMTEEIQTNLVNARRLEAARIVDALNSYENQASQLAAGFHIREFLGQMAKVRQGALSAGVRIGGIDDLALVDPAQAMPLTELADRLKTIARSAGSAVEELRILAVDGTPLGQSAGFSWENPYDSTLIERSIQGRKALFGNAFRVEPGDDRLGLVTPVVSFAGEPVGVLVLEMALQPVVGLTLEHEAYGETTESHIAQPSARGDAEFITLLRFKRDAAFTLVVPKSKGLPINQSLEAPGGRVVRARDYRSEMSILAIETIAKTGWGLVVKKDLAEAMAPVAEIRRVMLTASAVTCMALLAGWFLLLRPVGRRLGDTAVAADRIASGDYTRAIGDVGTDEIGEVSRAIDRLAADLLAGNALRTRAEKRLRYQATHDELTGLYNRKVADQAIRANLRPDADRVSSVLFLDLDGFKAINDTHGHATGDTILRALGRRLRRALDGAIVARWGGDEFVVILPGADSSAAREAAKFVRAVFDLPIATEQGLLSIDVSIGVATSGPQWSASDVLDSADDSMYAEKLSRGSRMLARDGAQTPDSVAVNLRNRRVRA